MFTGIVRETGTVAEITKKKGLTVLKIDAPLTSKGKKNGDSVAVDGACLTVTGTGKGQLTFEAIPETMEKTIIGGYKTGNPVNLESPLKTGDSLDGHMVLGHVDFIGTVADAKPHGASRVISILLPLEMAKYFAIKGSVTVNGVSLTVSKLTGETFEVSLIPQTLSATNLGRLKKESHVNIEIDVISRYLDSLLQDKAKESTYQFLQERGFI